MGLVVALAYVHASAEIVIFGSDFSKRWRRGLSVSTFFVVQLF